MPTQTRRDFVQQTGKCLAAAGAASAFDTGSASAAQRRQPNVIYLFSDEHRYQSMSIGDMPEVKTPNMAKLAEQGISFTNCVSNYPVCSPYRAILMTGRWPYHQKMLDDSPGMIDNNYPLSPEQMTLGKAFKGAGYTTGYIGKWHMGGASAEAFGFDRSLIWTQTNAHWDKSKYHPKDGRPVQPKGYNATLMTDQALDFIQQNRARPFFLMVSWNPPHSNFTDAPKEMKELYEEGSLKYRPNVPKPGEDVKLGGAKWRTYRGYHAHVSAIDRELGRVMQRLDELGVSEDTVLVYSSDHGSLLGSHGVGGKRQPYEESIKVPFLIRGPGIAQTTDTEKTLLGAIDLMPTLCGLADVSIPESCMGMDLSHVIRGAEGPTPGSQFIMHISKKNASFGDNHPAPLFRGITTGRYTYAVYPDRPWRLFDNEADPYQMDNRLDDPALADVRAELHAALAESLREAEDPFALAE